jgi:hypothetical protein
MLLSRLYALLLVFLFVIGFCSVSFAGVDFTDVSVDTADVFTLAGIILAAIGGIWGIKKLIALANKS